MFFKSILHPGNPVHAANPVDRVNPKLLILVSGLLISFFGSLPLGTVNVVMLQLAITHGYFTALWFAAGCLIAEMFYVAISVTMMDRIMKFGILLKMLQWVSLIILLGLAISSFVTAAHSTPARNIFVSDTLPPFFFGFLLMAANPVQIPFWFGWSTVLFERKILMPQALYYALYIVGAGLGSLLGSGLFIFGGQFLFAWFPATQKTLHLVIGSVFMVAAFLQGRKILWRPAPTADRKTKRSSKIQVNSRMELGG